MTTPFIRLDNIVSTLSLSLTNSSPVYLEYKTGSLVKTSGISATIRKLIPACAYTRQFERAIFFLNFELDHLQSLRTSSGWRHKRESFHIQKHGAHKYFPNTSSEALNAVVQKLSLLERDITAYLSGNNNFRRHTPKNFNNTTYTTLHNLHTELAQWQVEFCDYQNANEIFADMMELDAGDECFLEELSHKNPQDLADGAKRLLQSSLAFIDSSREERLWHTRYVNQFTDLLGQLPIETVADQERAIKAAIVCMAEEGLLPPALNLFIKVFARQEDPALARHLIQEIAAHDMLPKASQDKLLDALERIKAFEN